VNAAPAANAWGRGQGLQAVKRAVLHVARALGLFRLARWMTRDANRVLCYHGFNMVDEGRFRPSMYMPPELFAARLDFLRRHGFPVLTLSDAEAQTRAGVAPPCTTVITIDDGWYSTYAQALPLLRERHMPATIYVTSYYMDKQTPVYGMCVAYLFWKSRARPVDLSALGVPGLEQARDVDPGDGESVATFVDTLIAHGEDACDQAGRERLLAALAQALEVDLQAVVNARLLGLVTADELAEMKAAGWDVQLHTHRHRLPVDMAGASREIADNRARLERIAGRPLGHFCYPSGDWLPAHLAVLRGCGIESATTCDPGLVYRSTERLAMPRIMDTPNMAAIEFEAEMYGFADILRRAVALVGLRRGRNA